MASNYLDNPPSSRCGSLVIHQAILILTPENRPQHKAVSCLLLSTNLVSRDPWGSLGIPRGSKGPQGSLKRLFCLVLALFGVPRPGRYRMRNDRPIPVGFFMKKQIRKCQRTYQVNSWLDKGGSRAIRRSYIAISLKLKPRELLAWWPVELTW